MFQTPILLIIFNRPDTTRHVFEAIRKQKPRSLFVAADGPRHDREDDIEKCKAARDIINVDWECELHTLFSEENRGCGLGPSEAITWFFNTVEEGIILEDDVLPDPSFFPFMEEMLNHFRNDIRINMITGLNLLGKWKAKKTSYTFSHFGGSAGWATWRRVWALFDYKMDNWKTGDARGKIFSELKISTYVKHYNEIFDQFSKDASGDFWDYQWLLARCLYGGCSVIPAINLITNIGFGADATHTVSADHPQALVTAASIQFPLKHRKYKIDRFHDWYLFERFINPRERSLLKKILMKSIKVAIRVMSIVN